MYVCRPTGSEHAREMSHQMQGDAVVDWLLKDGAPIQLKQHLEIPVLCLRWTNASIWCGIRASPSVPIDGK